MDIQMYTDPRKRGRGKLNVCRQTGNAGPFKLYERALRGVEINAEGDKGRTIIATIVL